MERNKQQSNMLRFMKTKLFFKLADVVVCDCTDATIKQLIKTGIKNNFIFINLTMFDL